MERKLVCLALQRIRYPFSIQTGACKISSQVIRKEFIAYFTDKYNHSFIKSSPVVPFCDPTVPFVNAGMNQFKNIFLGQSRPPCRRAVNSQKCIRVGGKHNDLELVGSDGYHHTFFEMLGNWSFGDYFKEDACKMAWNLLTGPYMLDPDRLYVTYFAGDEKLGIGPDIETRDIWQKIGVPVNHILGFGSSDNFWEMGPSGPCGPCTEIHYDHISNRKDAAERVNLGYEDMVEIWNLVFIQYNRGLEGDLTKLPAFHVDTGMGLERLVAVLQNKRSNYDTDLFIPLFNAIQKASGAPSYGQNDGTLDREYRILADYCRMVTVALADGMFPDQNVKLRRILRKALSVAQKTFGCEGGLVAELTNHVGQSLGEAYPEIGVKMKQIQQIINHEEQVVLSLKKTALREWKTLTKGRVGLESLNIEMMPGIVHAFKELQCGELRNAKPSELAYKLYDTYGLDEDAVDAMCAHFKLQVDRSGFQEILGRTRITSRLGHLIQNDDSGKINNLMEAIQKYKLKPTDDSYKYSYLKEDKYIFPTIRSEIQLIMSGNQCVSEVTTEGEYEVVLDKTNLYHESGGQSSDLGHLVLSDETEVSVKNIVNIQGHLVHKIYLPAGCKLCTGENVSVMLNHDRRLGNMRNHTATHLVNAAVNEILQVTCQKSSRVADSSLMFEFAVYGENFNLEHILILEAFVHKAISSEVPVLRKTVSGQELQELQMSNQVTLVPGEVYPKENVHLIEIDVKGIMTSREPCCGTHVLNTSDLEDFCVTSMKTPATGTRTLWALTGGRASAVRAKSEKLWERVCDLKIFVNGLAKSNATREQV